MGATSPDPAYSGYSTNPDQPERCCRNCANYKPKDGMKGICYEYEVLPSAGCKFFKAK